MRRTLPLLLSASLLAPSLAHAQTVIMRRPIDQSFGSPVTPVPVPTPSTPTPTPVPTPTPTPVPTPTPTPTPVLQNSWVVSGWSDENACSSSSIGTRVVECVREDGVKVADSSCSGARPESTRQGAIYAGCSTGWSTGAWGPFDSTCSDVSYRERAVECRMIVPGEAGSVVEESRCTEPRPAAKEGPVSSVSGCSYEWRTTSWSGWSSTCSESATRSRQVTCGRSDGRDVDDAQCTTARPDASETSAIYSGCSYDPISEFSNPKNFAFTSNVGPMSLLTPTRWEPGNYMYVGVYDVGPHVMLHPGDGGVEVAVEFVAPRSGTYRFQGRYFAGNACGDGVRASFGDRSAVVYKNEVPFDYVKTMSAGEHERYAVNAQQDMGCDSTGLVLSVTQP